MGSGRGHAALQKRRRRPSFGLVRRPSGTDGKIALVLAGGGARGAYEVGVIQYILQNLSRDLDRPVKFDILCGSSIGAINACALAAYANDLTRGLDLLVRQWLDTRVADVLRANRGGVIGTIATMFGVAASRLPRTLRGGGLLDVSGIRAILGKVPFTRIDQNLRSGHLDALTVSATQVRTGRTFVFVQRAQGGLPQWRRDPEVVAKSVRIRTPHALASAAMPFLFPAVSISGELFCDGGLRQNVPLSPAHRLGASRVLVVNPHQLPHDEGAARVRVRESGYPDPIFLAGKAMNAILLDRIETDLDRLAMVNAILASGSRRFGPRYLKGLNQDLGYQAGQGLRVIDTTQVRASADIGHMASDYVRHRSFWSRVRGPWGRLLRCLGEGESRSEGDFLAYLLFDSGFASELMALGRKDARASHDELCDILNSSATICRNSQEAPRVSVP
jgi:NTE family protein